MENPVIPGGYTLLSRRILESAIWSKPPLYLKVWIYLLSRAQHTDYKGLKRGQLWTSIPELQDAMSYKVGFRTEKPTKKQIWSALEWLRNPSGNSDARFPCEQSVNETVMEPMIETTKGTHGILVNIVNYAVYQDPKNYESNNEGTTEGTLKGTRRERQGNNINKNDKNDKNDKYSRQVYDLLNYWNEQNIVVHQETDNTLRQIEKGLKNFSFDEIKTAIDRYVTIYRDSDYYYKHKWTLPKFLTQRNGVPDFLDEGIRWVNYQDQAPQQETSRSKPLEFY